jgi:hypothetical protein
MTNLDSLCTRVLKGKYFHQGNFMTARRKKNASHTWRAILASRQALELGLIRRIGDGTQGKRGGYASAKQNFPRRTGTTAVRDHGITTRRADAAEPSRCRRTRRRYRVVQLLTSFLTCTCGSSDPSAPNVAPPRYPHVRRRKRRTPDC